MSPHWKRFAIRLFKVLSVVAVFIAVLVGSGWWYFHPNFERKDEIVYAQRNGVDLTYDVVTPNKPNGIGIILMVSGGWKSGRDDFHPWMIAPLLRHGYVVFPVSHLSQPKATVSEIVEDMHRAVRFIRYHAGDYNIDPLRIGVTGGSAGGHLSLMMATRGGAGDADSSDPVDHESSSVQAVAIFYPVTDLLNLGESTENPGDGGPPKSFVKAFGPLATNMVTWKQIGRDLSPIYHLHDDLPPTLIYHGDADTLVPLDQSERFRDEALKMNLNVKVVAHHGGKHGWLSMIWDIREFANWFDEYLLFQ